MENQTKSYDNETASEALRLLAELIDNVSNQSCSFVQGVLRTNFFDFQKGSLVFAQRATGTEDVIDICVIHPVENWSETIKVVWDVIYGPTLISNQTSNHLHASPCQPL